MKLPYVEQGHRDGIPLLLLHGITDSWRSWEPVLPHLPESLRAIAVSQRGHGDAQAPESGYAMEDFATDAVELMADLGLDRAIVAGHSMGAQVAQHIAVEHPQRVAGLLLAGAFGTLRESPNMVGFDDELGQLTDPIDPAMVREFQSGTTQRPQAASWLDVVVAESLKAPARVWGASAAGLMEHDLAARLGTIGVPALLIWGDHDALATRQEQDWLVRQIPDAHLQVYRGTGHSAHWEEPERFGRDLTAFAMGAWSAQRDGVAV